ncbi:MAG: hypothetical protein HRF45_05435 [Fimbriimonadia bacterium]|jgi:arabinosyltransferase C
MAERRFVVTVSIVYLVICLLPNLFGLALAGDRFYTGFDLNTDDMCVYMAWMEQARRGHFLFDNRFTTEQQPRLTVHVFFFALGAVSRVTGLYHGTVFHGARIVFGFLFLVAAWRLICRVTKEHRARRIAFGVLLVSAGIGWTMQGMKGVTGPTDLWQPEGFTFPSLLNNALFACSLWLMVEAWLAILDAREHWRAILRGAAAMLVLGNIHTYDVLTMVLVAVAFALALAGAKVLSFSWVLRSGLILLGAIPSVAWLAYVRAHDPVFASRAATETFSPEPWQFVLGYLPLILLAADAVWLRGREHKPPAWLGAVGAVPLGVLLVLTFAGCPLNQPPEHALGTTMFLGLGPLALFIGIFAVLCVGAWGIGRVLGADGRQRPALLLVTSWAAVALWLPYFPALFQRKLTMGAHLPLAILAGIAIAEVLHRLPARLRGSIAVPAAALTLLSLSNLAWLRSSLDRISADLSSTGIHPVYLSEDQVATLAWMREHLSEDATAQDILPYACFIPALAGQAVYAGHWSETPWFVSRIRAVMGGLYGGEMQGYRSLSTETARELGVQYLLVRKPPPDTYEPDEPPADAEVAFDTPTVALLRVR